MGEAGHRTFKGGILWRLVAGNGMVMIPRDFCGFRRIGKDVVLRARHCGLHRCIFFKAWAGIAAASK